MFSTQTIAALVIGAALAFIIPIAAVIIFKLKNREASLISALVGAGTFIVFALVLESLLHQVMLPIVQGSNVAYIIYGALAAGIFEETGRFAANKLIMKNNYSTKNAIMMGLGHGGIEAIIALGITLIGLAGSAIMVNSQGLETTIAFFSSENATSAEALRAQLESLTSYGFANMAVGVYERIIAMIFHVCMSVIVYIAASQKGKLWFYPLAVLLHAGLDTFAAMFQVGIITSIPVLYAILTVFTAIVAVLTVALAKKFPDSPRY